MKYAVLGNPIIKNDSWFNSPNYRGIERGTYPYVEHNNKMESATLSEAIELYFNSCDYPSSIYLTDLGIAKHIKSVYNSYTNEEYELVLIAEKFDIVDEKHKVFIGCDIQLSEGKSLISEMIDLHSKLNIEESYPNYIKEFLNKTRPELNQNILFPDLDIAEAFILDVIKLNHSNKEAFEAWDLSEIKPVLLYQLIEVA